LFNFEEQQEYSALKPAATPLTSGPMTASISEANKTKSSAVATRRPMIQGASTRKNEMSVDFKDTYFSKDKPLDA